MADQLALLDKVGSDNVGAPALPPPITRAVGPTPSPRQAARAKLRTHRRSISPWQSLSIHAGLLCVCAGFLLPFGWMLSTSLKTVEQTNEYPPRLLPAPPQPGNYAQLFNHPTFQLLAYTHNTLVITLLTVAGTTLSSAVVAYGFARIHFPGRNALFAIMLATIMIPFPVTMVALFRTFRWIDDHTAMVLGRDNLFQMLGTFKPLWLPAWFGNAFSIFLLRQFFLTVPGELSEAARLDGCSELGVFLRIILPLARPALAVVALFAFMGTWNDFLGPLVYLQRPEQYTLALGLQSFQSQHGGTEWHLLMAASVLVCLPVLVLFFLTQKTFIRGIATTGGK